MASRAHFSHELHVDLYTLASLASFQPVHLVPRGSFSHHQRHLVYTKKVTSGAFRE